MVVRDGDLAIAARGGGENALDAARAERERPFAQHVHARRERAQHVRLVQMARRRDHHRVELVDLEHLIDVREHIRHAEPLRQRARLRAVVVAERHELRAAQPREHGKLRHLRDRADAYDTNTQGWLHGDGSPWWCCDLLKWNIPPARTVPKRSVPSTV